MPEQPSDDPVLLFDTVYIAAEVVNRSGLLTSSTVDRQDLSMYCSLIDGSVAGKLAVRSPSWG